MSGNHCLTPHDEAHLLAVWWTAASQQASQGTAYLEKVAAKLAVVALAIPAAFVLYTVRINVAVTLLDPLPGVAVS